MFKVTIKPKSSFITNLSSSTIFGAACWAIKEIYGDDILQEVFSDNESLAFSNAFISGYIPTGCTNKHKLKHIETGKEVHSRFRSYRVDHCEIDRSNQTSNKHWIEYENYETRNLDIYVSTRLFTIDDIKSIFELMLIKGLGKFKNSGRGQFKLVDIVEIGENYWNGIESNGINPGYMVISDYIPNKSDSTIGVYSARVVNRVTTAGVKCSPVYVINAGSKFAGTYNNEIIGRLQKDEDSNTYLSGRAIAIPIKV